MEELLNRYCQNLCSPEEEQEVIEYLRNPPSEMVIRGQLWQQWNRTAPAPPVNLKKLWTSVRQETELEPANSPFWHRPTIRTRLARLFILLGFMLALAGATYLFQHPTGSELTYETGRDQRLTVTLPDHSRVRLEPYSSLSFTTEEPFLDPAVHFTGSALFQIAPQTNGRQFILRLSDQLQLRGRRATFRTVSQPDGQVRISVRRGLMQLIQKNGLFDNTLRLALTAGDIVLYDPNANRLTRRRAY